MRRKRPVYEAYAAGDATSPEPRRQRITALPDDPRKVLWRRPAPLRSSVLPDELLLVVFRKLSVRDVQTIRQVCQGWRRLVDKNSAMLWEARCEALSLLPPPTSGVLGIWAERLRERACILRARLEIPRGPNRDRTAAREALITQLGTLYRTHYRKWAPHICRLCHPADANDFCFNCVPVSEFRWVRTRVCVALLSVLTVRPKKLRAVRCNRPPYPPLSWKYASILYRLDDILDEIAAQRSKLMATEIRARITASGYAVQ